MLCQLSYSPKNFGDLAAFARGYSYTVPTEADVYPNCKRLASTCHNKPSAGLVVLFVVGIWGCWRDATPAPVLSNAPPAPTLPTAKIAELGVLADRGEPTPNAEPTNGRPFRATNIIYMYPDTSFGWRIRLPCAPADDKPRPSAAPDAKPRRLPPGMVPVAFVEYREVMNLPAP